MASKSTPKVSANVIGGLSIDAEHIERIDELAALVTQHRADYYAARPKVSDQAYDALEDELRRLAPLHPALARVGSPVVADSWEKARHRIPMGSLNKVTNADELEQWLGRCVELLSKEAIEAEALTNDLFVTEKLDGISVELVYRDGIFADGITRGDGEIGERISQNVARMRGVPRRIDLGGVVSVRGEIILRLSDMSTHDAFADATSPRNAAAGTARRLDGYGNDQLTVMCYELAGDEDIATEVTQFRRLKELGFAVPFGAWGDVSEIVSVYDVYQQTKRVTLDYEIDGLVVRANQRRLQALLGDVNRRPRGAVAYKFASPQKLSRVVAIRWDTGPSGRVTPLAIVEPVELAGATVRRASLHNVARVQALGIAVGASVLVSRRNDVIPYIEEVVSQPPEAGALVAIPEACATCDAPLIRDGEYLVCRNDACPARVEGRIKFWIRAIGAMAWGEKLIATLVAKGMVKEPADLYGLTHDDIANLDRYGKKSADNIMSELHNRLPLRLETFLAALGIEGFAVQTARLVVNAGFGDIDAVMAATVEQLAAVDGLGAIKAKAIVSGLESRAEEIARLRSVGIEPVTETEAGPLAGKTFCITGTHASPRKELVRRIEDSGGRMLSGVTKELDYLLIADISSTSSKATKAKRYGTVLLDEAGLVDMLAPR